MAKLLTGILVFCAATTLAAWAVAAAKLRIENGKCRIAESFSKRANPPFYILHSKFSIHTAVFVFFAAIATLSAQKQGATNDPPRGASSPRAMPPAPAVVPVAVDSAGFSVPTNFPPVTNLCFWGVGRGTNAVEGTA